MIAEIKEFELQIDKKPNGYILRLNDENGCILRICQIPFNVLEPKILSGEEIDFIDIVYPK